MCLRKRRLEMATLVLYACCTGKRSDCNPVSISAIVAYLKWTILRTYVLNEGNKSAEKTVDETGTPTLSVHTDDEVGEKGSLGW